jgi:hypothetical protein
MRKLILSLVVSLGVLAVVGELSEAKAQFRTYYGRRAPVVVNYAVTPYASSYTYASPYYSAYTIPRASYGVTVTPGATSYYYSTPGYGYGVSYPNYSTYYSPYTVPVTPYYNPYTTPIYYP